MPVPKAASKAGRKLRASAVAARYSITVRTVDRWLEAGILPEPLRIHKTRYWDESEIEAMERRHTRAAPQQPIA
jgi:predicted DNA-binding transcriptional regulator AlpA